MTGQLVNLGLTHTAALEAFLEDFDATPEDLHGYFCQRNWTIEKVVTALQDMASGTDLKEGLVPCSTYFWEQSDMLQGVINIRHRLNPSLELHGGHIGFSVAPAHRGKRVASRMLEAGLLICQELGIEKALLTCDSSNEASRRTIEGRGGRLEKEECLVSAQARQRWYWIDSRYLD
ncbi:MAG: GNAT family N-acetyltransferase [Planctomycetes bacterium]|nr:GNAT family N-acetyltransferase [Planctomycetota bacterium]